jgi:hypothetical protein
VRWFAAERREREKQEYGEVGALHSDSCSQRWFCRGVVQVLTGRGGCQ